MGVLVCILCMLRPTACVCVCAHRDVYAFFSVWHLCICVPMNVGVCICIYVRVCMYALCIGLNVCTSQPWEGEHPYLPCCMTAPLSLDMAHHSQACGLRLSQGPGLLLLNQP